MRKFYTPFVALVLFTSCLGYKELPVEYDYSYKGNFKKYRTFDLMRSTMLSDSSMSNQVIEKSILSRMKFLGYKQTDNKPHLLVCYKMFPDSLDRTTYRLLSVLLAVGLENIKVICEHALVKRSTGSRAIDRMLERGWVRTESNEEDYRSTTVELTAEGKKIAGMLRQSTSKQLERAADGLSAAELKQLASILRRMTENLGRLQIE
jgi:DNA-binding MarR family transcriptional regulator